MGKTYHSDGMFTDNDPPSYRGPIYVKGRVIYIFGLFENGHEAWTKPHQAITIDSTDSGNPHVPSNNYTRFVFIDSPNPNLIRRGDDVAIADVIYQWLQKTKPLVSPEDSEFLPLIIRCEAGLSRSAGIGLAIARFLQDEGAELALHTHYWPNAGVAQAVFDALQAKYGGGQ